MEPTFVATPYLQANTRDSHVIRKLLDEQEAGYIEWRSNRKPVRHPFASSKLNSPLRVPQERQQASAKPLWLSLLETSTPSSSPHDNRPGSNSRSSVSSSRPATQAGRPNHSASTPQLPSLQRSKESPGTSLGRLSTAASLSTLSRSQCIATSIGSAPQRKKPSAAKRRLQRNLYDFHSSLVFSVAPPTETSDPQATQQEVRSNQGLASSPSNREPDVVVIELPPAEEADPYVVPGLSTADARVFSEAFEADWAQSDVDRIVRDAVERNRIKRHLQRSYRVLVLYFRQLAGKSALASTNPSSHFFASDLQQLANRFSLLEDLNVPCVDPVKFGLMETPLRRAGLLAFVIQAARMYAAHSPDPGRFRVLLAEGLELSEAVRTLLVDHVAAYAQIQDPVHFRDLFLRDGPGRRLRSILDKYEKAVSTFFFDAIKNGAASARASGVASVSSTTMSFHAFVITLRILSVIPAEPESRRSKASTAKVVNIDENRAMRIFQQCLDLPAELNGTGRPQLTYPQFVEALLRVTLVRHETAVCRGAVDLCPGQHSSDECHCLASPPSYDLEVFDDASEGFLCEIQTLRLQQSWLRSGVKMGSLRSIQQNTARRGVQRHHAILLEPDTTAP